MNLLCPRDGGGRVAVHGTEVLDAEHGAGTQRDSSPAGAGATATAARFDVE